MQFSLIFFSLPLLQSKNERMTFYGQLHVVYKCSCPRENRVIYIFVCWENKLHKPTSFFRFNIKSVALALILSWYRRGKRKVMIGFLQVLALVSLFVGLFQPIKGLWNFVMYFFLIFAFTVNFVQLILL